MNYQHLKEIQACESKTGKKWAQTVGAENYIQPLLKIAAESN